MTGERAFIGLGANLGDARSTLDRAIAALDALPGTCVEARSAFYSTAPIEASGPDFINAVVAIRTQLEPRPLLSSLQAIEHAHGRQRPFHHAPRTLDLDLLLYGHRLIDEAELKVPHPRLHERAFVLVPLLEIAPDVRHPRLGALAGLPVPEQAIRRLA